LKQGGLLKEQKDIMVLAKIPRLKLFLSKTVFIRELSQLSVMSLTPLREKFVAYATSRTRLHEHCSWKKIKINVSDFSGFI